MMEPTLTRIGTHRIASRLHVARYAAGLHTTSSKYQTAIDPANSAATLSSRSTSNESHSTPPTDPYTASFTKYTNRRKAYKNHVPLSFPERAFLAAGSAIMALVDPYRADMVAALGDTTSVPRLRKMRDIMLKDPTGRRILKERPSVTSKTVQLDLLRERFSAAKQRSKEAGQPWKWTFGDAYVAFIDGEGVSPDTRDQVKYLSASAGPLEFGRKVSQAEVAELAFVLQRHRECHDFYHAITGLPTTVAGELALKWFELLRVDRGLPVSALSSFFGPLRLTSEQRQILFGHYVPWAIRNARKGLNGAADLLCVYWEDHMERDLEELRAELGIEPPPTIEMQEEMPSTEHAPAL